MGGGLGAGGWGGGVSCLQHPLGEGQQPPREVGDHLCSACLGIPQAQGSECSQGRGHHTAQFEDQGVELGQRCRVCAYLQCKLGTV